MPPNTVVHHRDRHSHLYKAMLPHKKHLQVREQTPKANASDVFFQHISYFSRCNVAIGWAYWLLATSIQCHDHDMTLYRLPVHARYVHTPLFGAGRAVRRLGVTRCPWQVAAEAPGPAATSRRYVQARELIDIIPCRYSETPQAGVGKPCGCTGAPRSSCTY